MRRLLLFLLFLAGSLSLSAQNRDCRSIHKGSFRLSSKESGTTMIKRTNKYQIEENADLGITMVLDLKWIDDCTYELRPKEVIKGDPALLGRKGDVMTVHITEVKAHSYISVVTSSFSDMALEREIEIL